MEPEKHGDRLEAAGLSSETIPEREPVLKQVALQEALPGLRRAVQCIPVRIEALPIFTVQVDACRHIHEAIPERRGRGDLARSSRVEGLVENAVVDRLLRCPDRGVEGVLKVARGCSW